MKINDAVKRLKTERSQKKILLAAIYRPTGKANGQNPVVGLFEDRIVSRVTLSELGIKPGSFSSWLFWMYQ